MNFVGIFLLSGFCMLNEVGICLFLVEVVVEIGMLLMGVCLGYQFIGQVFGGNVVCCYEIVYGKMGKMYYIGKGVFVGLLMLFDVMWYYLLVVDWDILFDCFEIIVEFEDGIIMGLCYKELLIEGVQFYFELIVFEYGYVLLKNFFDMMKVLV